MAAHSEIQKGHEIANEMRRVNKQLKEAQSLAVTYNNRERLFGMPVTNVSYGSLLPRAIHKQPLLIFIYIYFILFFICLITDQFLNCSLQIYGAVFDDVHFVIFLAVQVF